MTKLHLKNSGLFGNYRKYLILTISLCLFLYTKCLSQSWEIKGKIEDKERKPISGATVKLLVLDTLKNASFLTTVSSETGTFFVTEISTGIYLINIEALGFDIWQKEINVFQNEDIGTIELGENLNEIAEVTVVGAKPLVSRKADRYVLNVSQSILSSGRSSLELMNYAPGVMVHGSSIAINGNTATKVMINGRLSRLSGEQLQNYLSNLRAEEIESIEVIPNPGAEYEAEGSGGLINIVLKKRVSSGWNGTLGLGITTPEWPSNTTNAQINYGNGGFQLYASHNYSLQNKYSSFGDTRIAENQFYKTDVLGNSTNRSHNFRLGTHYDFNEKHVLGIEFNGNINSSWQGTASHSNLENLENNQFNRIEGDFSNDKNNKLYTFSSNYNWKIDSISTIDLLADYTSFLGEADGDFQSSYSDQNGEFLFDSIYRNNVPTDITNYNLALNSSKKWNQFGSIKAGLKHTQTETNNNVLYEYLEGNAYVIDMDRTNSFNYLEKISALYVQYQKDWNKTSLQAGVRAEYTDSKGSNPGEELFTKSFFGIFPSFFLLQKLSENQTLSLKYSRRINRPTFSILNPFEWRVDDYTYVVGNPDLRPQYSNSVQLSYVFKNNYDITLFTSISDDVFGHVLEDSPTNGLITKYRWENISKEYYNGVNIYAPVKINSWWNMVNNMMLYRHVLRFDEDQSENSQNVFQGKTTQVFNLKDNWKIELAGYYQSSYISSNIVFVPNYSVDIGVNKSLWKNKLQVRALVTDIFNTDRMDNSSRTEYIDVNAYQKYLTRRFSLNLIYNFSFGKKLNIQKVQSGNTDEKNRMN